MEPDPNIFGLAGAVGGAARRRGVSSSEISAFCRRVSASQSYAEACEAVLVFERDWPIAAIEAVWRTSSGRGEDRDLEKSA